jgi:hypothetical protein
MMPAFRCRYRRAGSRLAAKFEALVEPSLGPPRTRELREVIFDLDNVQEIGSPTRLAAG